MKNSVSNASNLPLKVVYGYAFGEFGFTFFLVYIAYYLMYFLTDVLFFGTAVSAIIFTVCQWSEAVSVVVSGLLVDRSKKGYRRWMITGASLCWLFTILMFTKPDLPKNIHIALFAVFYFLAYGGYNLMWVSYRSILGKVSRRPYDTVVLSTTGSQLGTIAAILFSLFGVKVLTQYGEYPIIYGVSAALCVTMLLAGIFTVFTITKPYDTIKYNDNPDNRYDFKSLRHMLNGSMISMMVSIAFRSAVSVMTSALLIYYLRYVLKEVSFMSFYVTSISIASFLGAYSARKLARFVEKKHIYIGTGIINFIIYLMLYFVGQNKFVFIVLMVVNVYFMFLGNVLVPVFLNDLCDYNFYRNKVDVRGLTFSLGSLSLNASQILGSGIASFGLVVFGYNSHETISESTILGIRYLMSFVPACVIGIGIVAFLFYNLQDATMEEIRGKLSIESVE